MKIIYFCIRFKNNNRAKQKVRNIEDVVWSKSTIFLIIKCNYLAYVFSTIAMNNSSIVV